MDKNSPVDDKAEAHGLHEEHGTYDPSEASESRKELLWWLYLAHGASLLLSLGLLSFIPLIVNYLKRSETEGSFLRTHHSWQIRSFWWYIGWLALGWLMFFTIFGIPLAALIFIGAWVWKAYRLIRGFIDLSDNQSMPA